MIIRLSKSLIRGNKFVTAAMLIMYIIIMALLVMLNFFSDSFDESLDSYMEEYGYPQTVLVARTDTSASAATTDAGASGASATSTDADASAATTSSGASASSDASTSTAAASAGLFGQSDVDAIREMAGVETVSPRMTVDYFTDIEVDADNKRYLKLRYNTTDENLKFYDVENDCAVRIKADSVMVPYVFAKANNIDVGDELNVKTASGINSLTVTNIISCPETISVKRDSFENYDDNDFTYIYISEEIGQTLNAGLLQSAQLYNQILIMGDEERVIESLKAAGYESKAQIIGYSSSNINHQIHNSTDAARAVIIYMVIFIAVIGTVFTTLFINQIVLKSKKFIALLRALGMGAGRVVFVFLVYVLSIILAASLLGVGIGYALLKLMLGIYQNYFVMPQMVVSGSLLKMLGLLLAEFVIGTLACILSAHNIAKVDPVGVFNAGVNGSKGAVGLPKLIDKVVRDGFTKISLCGIRRNKRRIIITILCNIACITLTCAGLEIIVAKQEAFEYNLNNRMNYDLIVGTTDEALVERLKASDSVDAAEAISRLSVKIENSEEDEENTSDSDRTTEDLLINALDDDSELIDMRTPDGEKISLPEYGIVLEEGYAERNGFEIGDTVRIGNVDVKVKNICREYIVPVAFMSQKQLEATGYGGHNAVIVLTSEDARYYDFAHEFEDADYIIYTTYRGLLALETMNKLNAPCRMFIICAMLLGFIIVYNINQLSLMERKKEFRTLRLLGTQRSKFFKILSIEALAEFIPAVIIGSPIGIISSRILEHGMSSLSMHYVMTKPVYVAALSCLLAALYLLLSIIMNMRNIRKLV